MGEEEGWGGGGGGEQDREEEVEVEKDGPLGTEIYPSILECAC